ncbi:hypothetical protein [Mesorhizobium retamae]|uniref:Uncharacterized protein n=1 Tax=Mesorhizobium retamae TaxID=2912854 RepID=A0ABS9QP09_9HYPH|nr:hypothetical protein [Mesorhizobium sp. IRAMC:0171]MCG7509193.1 hypothetical protein [Mesorhizobium sp. IRAMC:0171]
MKARASDTQVEFLPAFRKDAVLSRLADAFNVAQFVSFAPSAEGPVQQFARIAGIPTDHRFNNATEAIEVLFSRSVEGTLNVRSFNRDQPQSAEFLYGLGSPADVIAAVTRLSSQGWHTIVNETVDVSDGGVSGVVLDNVVEFGPDVTPRGVEKAGFATLPTAWARALFDIVYGFSPDFDAASRARLEFSLHPRPRGYRQSHVIYWEFGRHEKLHTAEIEPRWPNSFSRMLGDKAYGLLIGHLAGAPVPRTTVISRRVAPFSFGRATGTAEFWTRTCPKEQVPGRFTTARGWIDPFRLLAGEDPDHRSIASVISQEGVAAVWSGAAILDAASALHVEGVPGTGDNFMLGKAAPAALPTDVRQAVETLYQQLSSQLGPVRFEWVFDGSIAWLVQLHKGRSVSSGSTIVPGDAAVWQSFDVRLGLDALRKALEVIPFGHGLLLEGEVGLTSHIADVVRKAAVPTRIEINAAVD